MELRNHKPEDSLQIIEQRQTTIYAFKAEDTEDDFLLNIKKLYQKLKNLGIYNKLMDRGMYAITRRNEAGKKEYWVGCSEQMNGSQKIVISAGKYMSQFCKTDDQSSISTLIQNMLSRMKQNGIETTNYECIEEYVNGGCHIYLSSGRKLEKNSNEIVRE